MTQQEHEAQRQLVTLSLLLCPVDTRHTGKGHDAEDQKGGGKHGDHRLPTIGPTD